MPNVIMNETKCSEESLEMLRFAMANATLRERYTQHDKTGSFILWLTPIPCPFFVGRVKRQRNPTHLLGFVPQPNLQIKTFFNFDKVLLL
ncbi:hypothetical protein AA650_10110 [Anabaena sp. WA102]|jgi:hypothetical protein|nr:hypothetical protein AA650_10110 [Anabaena sp. WA102]OBQ15325.1 MAG: hypothetical protein AN486_23825 [Anabaena sp. AL93]